MLTHPRRAMRPTNEEIESANAELLAMGWFPVSGGAQTPEEIAAAEAEAKRLADEEAARIAEQEKQLSEAGKAALKAERDARKAADRAAAEAKAELEALRAEKAKADEEKRKAEEAEAAEKGEYKQIADRQAIDLKTKDDELTAANAKIASLVTALKPEVDEAWKTLPAEITTLYAGAADDVLGKREFMATHRKLIDRLAEGNEVAKNGVRTPITPKPNGRFTPDDERRAQQQSGQYTPM